MLGIKFDRLSNKLIKFEQDNLILPLEAAGNN
jgi:hypothetical protein